MDGLKSGFPQRGKVNWAGLRVAGLCVGVDQYEHMGHLNNAVRDASYIHKRLKAAPGCHSAVLSAPATAGELLRTVRHHVQDRGLLENPPALFVFYYAGHGIQEKGRGVYLVPANAHVEHPDDLDHECLSLDKLLKTMRQELDEVSF